MTERRSFLESVGAFLFAPIFAYNRLPRPIERPVTAKLYRIAWIEDDGTPDGKIVGTQLVRARELPSDASERGCLHVDEWIGPQGSDAILAKVKAEYDRGPYRKDWWRAGPYDLLLLRDAK